MKKRKSIGFAWTTLERVKWMGDLGFVIFTLSTRLYSPNNLGESLGIPMPFGSAFLNPSTFLGVTFLTQYLKIILHGLGRVLKKVRLCLSKGLGGKLVMETGLEFERNRGFHL